MENTNSHYIFHDFLYMGPGGQLSVSTLCWKRYLFKHDWKSISSSHRLDIILIDMYRMLPSIIVEGQVYKIFDITYIKLAWFAWIRPTFSVCSTVRLHVYFKIPQGVFKHHYYNYFLWWDFGTQLQILVIYKFSYLKIISGYKITNFSEDRGIVIGQKNIYF